MKCVSDGVMESVTKPVFVSVLWYSLFSKASSL